jgi:hypothetical protein
MPYATSKAQQPDLKPLSSGEVCYCQNGEDVCMPDYGVCAPYNDCTVRLFAGSSYFTWWQDKRCCKSAASNHVMLPVCLDEWANQS